MTDPTPAPFKADLPTQQRLSVARCQLAAAVDDIRQLAVTDVNARGDILKMLLELFKELLPIILPLLIEPLPVPDAT
jgi:hypothetical protein